MTMVTSPQGIDLGRMICIHEIYLTILHGAITFDDGTDRLEEVMSRERRYCNSLCVLMCKPAQLPPQHKPMNDQIRKFTIQIRKR